MIVEQTNQACRDCYVGPDHSGFVWHRDWCARGDELRRLQRDETQAALDQAIIRRAASLNWERWFNRPGKHRPSRVREVVMARPPAWG